MSATTLPAQRYMRAFVHIPMLMMDHPSRVLVICFGVGNTLNAASLYDSVTELELADLSKNVLEHASYFAGTNGDVIADPRLSVFVDDGRAHLRAVSEGRYDLITLEPPPIRFAGVSSLYSREFYDLARSRLKEGGYMSQWLPLYQIPGDTVLELVRAFVDVFPGAALMAGSGEEFMLVGKRGGPVTFDLDHVERALWSLPKIELDLAHVHMGTLVELAGAFVADDSALREATASASPLTDDRPDLEYTMWRAPSPPSGLVALEGIHGYCIDCYVDGQPDVRLSALDEYLEAQRRQYAKWRLVPASTSRSH